MRLFLFSTFFITLAFNSCKSSGETYIPQSSGNINHVSIVMDDRDWNGPLGQAIRDSLEVPYIGLPWDEPQFTLHHIVPQAFTDFARQSRNVLRFAQDSIPRFRLAQDQYARPQLYALVTGEDTEDQLFLFNANLNELRRLIVENEQKEKIRRIKRSPSTDSELQDRFGIDLTYPTAYQTLKDTTNFVWIQKPTQNGHMNIIAYSLDINALDGPTRTRIPLIRDSIGQQYLPGRLDGSYMITEAAYRPYFFATTLAGLPGYLTKGMWEVKGDFMAGPFVNYMLRDTTNNRWISIEGFTFAPNSAKRDNMFELNSILNTLALNETL
ncbi:MAG: DUF4837 family protein [Flavobacteriaceae bacterium]|nr:DUF4837 family protein [Flavobacteriaceae bacterium]